MNLPWIGLQAVYAHVAWGLVLAACGVGALSWRNPFPARLASAWLVLAFVACALPGAASPAYWLSLAFYIPSPLFVACCTMTMWMNARGRVAYRVMPTGLALGVFGVGLLLYADSVGWLRLGLYMFGFGPEAAFAGVLTGAAAVLALLGGTRFGPCLAVLLSLLLYAVCRLPTGNVWDVLIDPILWLWSLCSLVSRARLQWRTRASRRMAPAAATP